MLCTDLSELEGPKSFEGAYKYVLKCTLRQMYESFYSCTPNVSFKFAYYSSIVTFYHIRSREQAEYEAVIHCSVLV